MELIQHMIDEAVVVRNKVAAKRFKPNSMIMEDSGFTNYVCAALEIRKSNIIKQII